MRAVAVALELEDAVDEVLEHARPGDRAVLRHVADEDRRDARSPSRRAAAATAASRTCATEPGAEPSSAEYSVCTESITQTSGRSALERLADGLELGLGEDLDVRGAAEPLGAQLHLRHRLLARDEQRRGGRALIAASAVRSSVDLPTPGSPPTSTSDAGTSPPPSTRSSSGTPVEIRAASSTCDVDEAQQRLRRRLRACVTWPTTSSTSVPNAGSRGSSRTSARQT